MGYLTTYDANILGFYDGVSDELQDEKLLPEHVKRWISEEFDRMNVLTECSFGDWYSEPTTWYDCDKDMLLLSKRFPNVVFVLSGVGDDQFDIWKEYFHNGSYQVCPAEIRYDSYSEKKMMKAEELKHDTYSYEQ